jgi:hypothetical protein
MSRNGSGTYNLPAGNPVVSGTTITTTWANTTLTDIANTLTASVAADGQTPMTGALNMGANKVTALAIPTVATDAATKAYVDLTQTASGITGGTITGATLINDTIDNSPIGSTTRSSVKATTLDLGLASQSVAIGQGNSSLMKNRIINGAMVIDQRNAGASVTPTAQPTYPVDRFYSVVNQTAKLTAQQNAGAITPPSGFANYVGFTSSSAYTSLSTDYFQFKQIIEGYNIADLGWGTANAKTITVSFWVYSSLTGQFGGAIRNAPTYSYTYPFSFTIASANTWQQISITIAGANASQGVWGTGNGGGLELVFDFGCGSTFLSTSGSWQSGSFCGATGDNKLVGTSGATFYITGVQLEVGSSATGYEYRQYGQELALCQRYYNLSNMYLQASPTYTQYSYPAQMRTNPTIAGYGAGGALGTSSVSFAIFLQTGGGNQNITFTSEL